MFTAIINTIKSLLNNKTLRRTMWLCLLLTIVCAIAFIGLVITILSTTNIFDLAWLETIADLLGGAGSFVVAWFLLPIFMPLIAGLMEDNIIKAAYGAKQDPVQQKQSFLQNMAEDARFMGVAILLNILVLPLYFVPIVNIFIYYLLNGYLLGREFFTNVAGWHLGKKPARLLFKEYKLSVFGGGVLLAFIATVPGVSFFAPFIAIVMMVHFFHKINPHK